MGGSEGKKGFGSPTDVGGTGETLEGRGKQDDKLKGILLVKRVQKKGPI